MFSIIQTEPFIPHFDQVLYRPIFSAKSMHTNVILQAKATQMWLNKGLIFIYFSYQRKRKKVLEYWFSPSPGTFKTYMLKYIYAH